MRLIWASCGKSSQRTHAHAQDHDIMATHSQNAVATKTIK